MQMPLYELKDVSYQSGNFRALDIKKFEIHRGTVYSISGRPGSGKSVLMSILSNNLKPNSGDVKYEGQTFQEISKKELSNQLAIVPQSDKACWGTVRKYFEKTLSRYEHTQKDMEKRIDKISKQMEISHLFDRPMKKLTPGQLRWVILAANIAADTKVLLIDEIEKHLSPDSLINLVRILYKKSNYDGNTVIVTTQNPEALKKMVTIFITMNSGRISSVRSAVKRRKNH